MIVYRVKNLWDEKQQKEKRRIPLLEISKDTGINRNTLAKLTDPRQKPYNTTVEVIDKLCKYFDCQPGDLLVYVPDEEQGR
ncbi:MAG: putative transcriptional regulator [Clostridia bacterium]|nr:putative transcriptional regulator [Clostridia bacterium]